MSKRTIWEAPKFEYVEPEELRLKREKREQECERLYPRSDDDFDEYFENIERKIKEIPGYGYCHAHKGWVYLDGDFTPKQLRYIANLIEQGT